MQTIEVEDQIDRADSAGGLSPDELEFWEVNGYVGPFTAWTPEEVERMRPAISATYQRPTPVYGYRTNRDRHLDCLTIFKLATHPAIIERCAALMGPDLLVWRANLFHKNPGGPETMWHQGWDFAGPRNVPALDPPVNATAWIAITDSDKSNACLQVLPGSHLGGKAQYETVEYGAGVFGSNLQLKGVDFSGAVHMEVKAGQFFLFNERTFHGADANNSDRHRIGIGVRFTPTSTKIYTNQKVCGQGFHLKNWHAVLVRGEDRYGHNRLGPAPDRDEYPLGLMQKLAGKIRRRWQYYVYDHGRQSEKHVEHLRQRGEDI